MAQAADKIKDKKAARRSTADAVAAPESVSFEAMAFMPGVDSAPDADALKASERRRKVRRWKVALTLAGLAAVALLVWRCLTTPFLAIDSVEVRGPVETLGLQEVVGAVRTSLKGNMLTADIEAVKHAVEEISWVKSAAVMRVWPHALFVDVVRHQAVAIFEDGRLVSDEGVLFVSNDEPIERLVAMPTLSGDPQYVGEAVRLLPLFEAQAKRVSARIKAVEATFRGSWSVVIESARFDAMKIELGRALTKNGPVLRLEQVMDNLERIADMMQGYPESIDARYRDAFAAQIPNAEARARWLAEHPKPEVAAQAQAPSGKDAAAAAAPQKTDQTKTDRTQKVNRTNRPRSTAAGSRKPQ